MAAPPPLPPRLLLPALGAAAALLLLLRPPEEALALVECGLGALAVYRCEEEEARFNIALLMTVAAFSVFDGFFPSWTENWRFRLFSILAAHSTALLLRPRLVKAKPEGSKKATVGKPKRDDATSKATTPGHSRTLSAWRARSAASVDNTYEASTFYENAETGETTWEKPADFLTDEEREELLDRQRMKFDSSRPLKQCLSQVESLSHELRLEQLSLMIKYVGTNGDWWMLVTDEDSAMLRTLVGESTNTPLARASLALFLENLLGKGDPVRALMLASDVLFGTNDDTSFLDMMALGLHEGGPKEKKAWIQLAKIAVQARFDCPLRWNNDVFVLDLFTYASHDDDPNLTAIKALIGLNWYLTGGVGSELAVCSSLLPSPLDVSSLAGLVRTGELGMTGSSPPSELTVKNPNNSVMECALSDALFASKLTGGVLFILNSLGGASTRTPPRPAKLKGRPSLRKQVSDRRSSMFEYVSKDACLLTQTMRMLITLLFHDEAENCLLFQSDLSICLDLLLLELASSADDEFSRFSILQALLGVLVRAEYIVPGDNAIDFPKRKETLQCLESIVHSNNSSLPPVYRVVAAEIIALLGTPTPAS